MFLHHGCQLPSLHTDGAVALGGIHRSRSLSASSPPQPSCTAVQRRRHACVAAAGFQWPNLFGMGQKQSGFEAAVRRDRDRLLTLLLSHEGLTPADKAELDELVAGLAGTRLPFVEAKLGGGPWVVLYTSGAPQLWRTTYTMGKAVSGRRNLASQDFDPATRSALNRAEYWGGDVWVSAAGTYEPLDDSTSCPKPIQANIESGKLGLWGLELGLPIRGTGTFEVLYLDEELRVFKARDSYAVQVKESALDELTERLG